MVSRCFRHQHPEAYGGLATVVPALPMELLCGREREALPRSSQPPLVEDVQSFPGAYPLAP